MRFFAATRARIASFAVSSAFAFAAVACSSGDDVAAADASPPPAGMDGSPPVLVDAGAPEDAGTLPDATLPGDAAVPKDAAVEASAPRTYQNPVLDQDFPDPFVLREGSTYFAFATNAGKSNIQSATSSDLAHWSVQGDALPELPAWAEANASLTWAPSVLPRGASTFVLYYTARDISSGYQCISRATSTAPGGPYEDSSAAPLVCQTSLCGSIDPSPFVDRDGTAYLLWKSDENACGNPPRLWEAQLAVDGTTLTGPMNELLEMDESWQAPIIEGPAMTLIAGTYYLVYSANNYASAAYSMGYATCLSPTGPCKNVSVGGPFVASAGPALGPGGGEFFTDDQGALWLAYHAWTAPVTTYAGGGARSLRIDRIGADGGVLALDGPTTALQTY